MITQSKKFKSCCAPFCTNTQTGHKNIGVNGKILSFHKFPQTNARLYARWVSFCCFQKEAPADPVLCSDHFENKDISLENVVNDRVIRVLWPHAVPTIQTRKDKTPVTCAVTGCNFSNTMNIVKHLYQFPKPAFHTIGDVKLERLRQQRRNTWIHLLGMVGISDSVIDASAICSAHFVSGRPSHTSNTESVDWSPSLHLSAPRTVKMPAKFRDYKPSIKVKSNEYLTKNNQPQQSEKPRQQYVILNRFPVPAISMSTNLPTRPLPNVSVVGRPKVLVTIRPNPPSINLSPFTKISTIPSIGSTTTLAKLPLSSMKLDSLSETTNLKELFVNGELDHSQMGRTVKIDQVVNGVQQSFRLKLLEPPPSSNEEILSDDIHANVPVALSNDVIVLREKQPRKQPSSLNKRVSRLRCKIAKKRKQWSYKDYIVRKLSQRCKNKLKKQSFKNLVLSYRTLQKNCSKNRENIDEDDDCIIID